MKKNIILTLIVTTAGLLSASAQYALPDGSFYRGWMCGQGNFGKAIKGTTQVLTPSGAPLTYKNISQVENAVWSYQVFNNGAWENMTSNDKDLTTPSLLSTTEGCNAPILNGMTIDATIHNAGRSELGENVIGYFPVDLTQAQNSLNANMEIMYYPELSISNGFKHFVEKAQVEVKPNKIGFIMDKPAAPVGVKGVVFYGYIRDQYNVQNSGFMSADVCRITADNTIGETIASARISKADIQKCIGENGFASFAIPFETAVNIEEPVAVLIGDFWGSVAIPSQVMTTNTALKPLSKAIYVTADNKFTRWCDIPLHQNRDNKDLATVSYLLGYGIGLLLDNSIIVTPGEAGLLDIVLDSKTQEKTITLTPDTDLKNAVIGSTADWFEVTIGDRDETTGKQPLTVQTTGYTEGRNAEFTVTAIGNRTTFKVAQSDNTSTGIDDTLTDTEVVSNEYYDIMGHRLQSEPTNGFYIRRDIMTDGTSTIVKIIR